jgi:nucleotide-binding universal stress UspA family protein
VSRDREGPTIRRILVALDASSHSLAALEAAVELAARFQAELSGLYVKDVNILRLGELSFVQEVGHFTATRRQLGKKEVQRQIQAQMVRAQRIFEGSSQRVQVRHSFQVTQGLVPAQVLAAASTADMIVLGRSGWSLLRPGRMGSTARAILSGAPGLALILEEGERLCPPVVVFYDGSPQSRKAFAAAAALAEGEDDPLVVILRADSPERAASLRAEIGEWLGRRELDVRYETLSETTVPRLVRILQAQDCGTLVLPAQGAMLQDEFVQALMDQVHAPVLLAR